MPIFLFVAISLFTVLGVIVLGYAVMAGSESSTDVTAQTTTEAWWEVGSGWLFGLAVLMGILGIFLVFYFFFVR